MEGIYTLGAFALAMFFGSYFAGLIPLAFTMSEGRIRYISIFGAGLLVGTALSVIIPEGVEVLYSAQTELINNEGHHHNDAGVILEKNIRQADVPPRIIPYGAHLNDALADEKLHNIGRKSIQSIHLRKLQQIDAMNAKDSLEQQQQEQQQLESLHTEEEYDDSWAHKAIGFSLVIGFLVMLLIDEASRAATSAGGERSRFGLTATIGLIVHAAADGVALGSASATNRADVQFIVFLAIMLHKAPAAFGLVSFLLVEGLERTRARRHLLAFSLSAPITALLTFYTIELFGSNSSFSTHSFTGILMLFSAGTFLYVATVHVLPELTKGVNDYQLMAPSGNSGHSHSPGVVASGTSSFTVKELLAMIIGALFPAVIASGHSHSH